MAGCFASPAKPRLRYREGTGFFRVLHWVDGGEVNTERTTTVGPFASFLAAMNYRLLSYRDA
jgi:hypothetical protein